MKHIIVGMTYLEILFPFWTRLSPAITATNKARRNNNKEIKKFLLIKNPVAINKESSKQITRLSLLGLFAK